MIIDFFHNRFKMSPFHILDFYMNLILFEEISLFPLITLPIEKLTTHCFNQYNFSEGFMVGSSCSV